MPKKMLLGVLIYVILLTIITLVDPTTGFQVATFTGVALSVPIVIALRVAMFLRGGM
jgi:hypothetical protein